MEPIKVSELKDKFNYWIEEIKIEYSFNTYKTYKNTLLRFFKYLEDKGIEVFTKEDFYNYGKYLKQLNKNYYKGEKDKEKLSYDSYKLLVTMVNRFFKDIGLSELKIKGLKSQNETFNNNSLTVKEYKRLLKKCYEEEYPMGAILIKVFCGCGIRAEELKFFSVENIKKLSKKNPAITVINKGKSRSIVIGDSLRKELKQYVKDNDIKEGLLFPSKHKNKEGKVDKNKLIDLTGVKKKLKKIAGKAKIKKSKIFWHNFRHFFAQQYNELPNANIADLADLLGHESIDTTRRYTKKSQEKQRNIINQIEIL